MPEVPCMHLTTESGDPVAPVLLEEDGLGLLPPSILVESLTEDEDSGDDPLRTYLREIHEVNLLTAADERMLACRMEEMIAIDELRMAMAGAPGTPALAVSMRLYERIYDRSWLAEILSELSGITDLPALLQDQRVRQRLDYVPDIELGEVVAARAPVDPIHAQASIVRFSIDTRLMAPDLLGALESESALAMPTPDEVRARLEARDCEAALAEFLDDIDRKSVV